MDIISFFPAEHPLKETSFKAVQGRKDQQFNFFNILKVNKICAVDSSLFISDLEVLISEDLNSQCGTRLYLLRHTL